AAMRGIVQTSGDPTPEVWQRFLDIHLAGMRETASPQEVQLAGHIDRDRSGARRSRQLRHTIVVLTCCRTDLRLELPRWRRVGDSRSLSFTDFRQY
ncbi:MAG TPA: hypothetical protein VKD72_36855, partial [Gemmataceae bacterium]|nr:hypothetical protein [Gemmataceae bacterium]